MGKNSNREVSRHERRRSRDRDERVRNQSNNFKF
jgi:hypothetical protein